MRWVLTFGADLAAADAACMDRARAGGLPGSYVAFVSTRAKPARDRIAGARGWQRVDGKPLLDFPGDFANGKIYYPLVLDEFSVKTSDQVATGSHFDGTPGYTYDAPTQIEVGWSTATAKNWIDNYNNEPCATPARIYCLGSARPRRWSLNPSPGGRRSSPFKRSPSTRAGRPRPISCARPRPPPRGCPARSRRCSR
jgi:hypothetical protein